MTSYANPDADRRKLKWIETPLDLAIEVLALLALLASPVLIALSWRDLPQRIPHHFNFAGNPDSWGPKWILFLLPAISVVVYVILTVVARVPHRLNVPWELTPENAERTYRIGMSLLRMLKAEVAILFTYIAWQTIRAAHQQTFALGKFFLLVVIMTLLITIVAHMLAAYRAR